MATSLTNLQRYAVEGDDFLSIVIDSETWMHQYSPEKMKSMARKHPTSPPRKKF
jgi:hypothetical protein